MVRDKDERASAWYKGTRYGASGQDFVPDRFGTLDLSGLGIENMLDIEGLENLVDLGVLDLGRNRITKIEGLDNLKTLRVLHVNNNNVTKIEGLEKLT
nr:hypothetical protein [Candidatus Sigynarchaeota archaeon]